MSGGALGREECLVTGGALVRGRGVWGNGGFLDVVCLDSFFSFFFKSFNTYTAVKLSCVYVHTCYTTKITVTTAK